jgi:DNA adenine methylase
MKYMGSKNRFAKEILQILLKNRKPNQWYIEPFAGGMNVISEVTGNRIANDIHFYLIEMWKELCNGWVPQKITKEEYKQIKANQDFYPPALVGWVGFNCSYSGKWFGGYAGETQTKVGTIRDYQLEAIKNIKNQVGKMKGVIFQNVSYDQIKLPPNSLIYCDPPYKGTTPYNHKFNHEKFWDWVRATQLQGHVVFTSEYHAPSDFSCIWEKQASSSLSANGKSGGNKMSLERLFVYKE